MERGGGGRLRQSKEEECRLYICRPQEISRGAEKLYQGNTDRGTDEADFFVTFLHLFQVYSGFFVRFLWFVLKINSGRYILCLRSVSGRNFFVRDILCTRVSYIVVSINSLIRAYQVPGILQCV